MRPSSASWIEPPPIHIWRSRATAANRSAIGPPGNASATRDARRRTQEREDLGQARRGRPSRPPPREATPRRPRRSPRRPRPTASGRQRPAWGRELTRASAARIASSGAGVLDAREVARVLADRDGADRAAHDLRAAGPGELGRRTRRARAGTTPRGARRPAARSSSASASSARRPGRSDHDAPDRLALDARRARRSAADSDHGGVGGERALDLGGAEPLAGHAQRVVAPAVQEPEPVVVAARPVAVDPDAREPPPVRVEVALGVAPDPAGHRRPRLAADELADLAGPDRRAPGHRRRRRPCRAPGRASVQGFSSQIGSGERKHAPDLGPAGQVDDRQPAAADLVGRASGRGRGSTARPSRRGSGARRGRAPARVRSPTGWSARIKRRRHAERGHAVSLDERPQTVRTRGEVGAPS